MVIVPLQLIKAERTGNWFLHLSSVAAMTQYFFAISRHNYTCWLPVYIADMKQLGSKHPSVHQEFAAGNHAVSCSSQPFTQEWTDMVLEQSINADSKSKGGIIGISQSQSTLGRWFLTCHARAAVTMALKVMYTIHDNDRLGTHKEAAPKRVQCEGDVQKLVNCFTSGSMTDPFSQTDTDSLLNLATGVVLPTDVADNLVNSTKNCCSR